MIVTCNFFFQWEGYGCVHRNSDKDILFNGKIDSSTSWENSQTNNRQQACKSASWLKASLIPIIFDENIFGVSLVSKYVPQIMNSLPMNKNALVPPRRWVNLLTVVICVGEVRLLATVRLTVSAIAELAMKSHVKMQGSTTIWEPLQNWSASLKQVTQ